MPRLRGARQNKRRCLTSESEQVAYAAPSPPQLGGEGKAAGAAAWAAHADQQALLLLVGEIGAVEHFRGLLLEQVVQRQIAGVNLFLRQGIGWLAVGRGIDPHLRRLPAYGLPRRFLRRFSGFGHRAACRYLL